MFSKNDDAPYAGEQWEYKTITVPSIDGGTKDQADKFNQLGGQGWEFQAVLGGPKVQQAMFKRRKISTQA